MCKRYIWLLAKADCIYHVGTKCQYVLRLDLGAINNKSKKKNPRLLSSNFCFWAFLISHFFALRGRFLTGKIHLSMPKLRNSVNVKLFCKNPHEQVNEGQRGENDALNKMNVKVSLKLNLLLVGTFFFLHLYQTTNNEILGQT